MGLTAQIILGCIGWVLVCVVAGFVETWWEQRKRDKERIRR